MSDAGDPLATETRAAARRPGATTRRVRLRAVFPPDLEWSAELTTGAIVIGRIAGETRDAAAVAPLSHSTVSRTHLRVQWDAKQGVHRVLDLGSHNGTSVDGREVAADPVELRDGSVVCPGDVCLVYEQGDDGGPRGTAVTSILGRSPAAGDLREAIVRAAADPSPVLVIGATGTGKEFIARELHRLSGRAGPLVAVNCAALSPELIDSQLFGHVKGAFTGAATDHAGLFRAAHGGTLFLDEIGEMPLPLQPKLLRALQEGEVQPVGAAKGLAVDVRVVAATNRPLATEVEHGRFRRDLYARLALWEIAAPSLAQRRGDLLSWLERLRGAWVDKRPRHSAPPLQLAPEAAEAILLHPWPNNLRQLDRLVHELSSRGSAEPVAAEALPDWLQDTAPDPAPGATESDAGSPDDPRPPVPTKAQFTAQWQRLDGNVRALARHFGRDRRQIYRWIETHGLASRRPPKP
jgi:DNA-binding NtrC family response regulator